MKLIMCDNKKWEMGKLKFPAKKILGRQMLTYYEVW